MKTSELRKYVDGSMPSVVVNRAAMAKEVIRLRKALARTADFLAILADQPSVYIDSTIWGENRELLAEHDE